MWDFLSYDEQCKSEMRQWNDVFEGIQFLGHVFLFLLNFQFNFYVNNVQIEVGS